MCRVWKKRIAFGYHNSAYFLDPLDMDGERENAILRHPKRSNGLKEKVQREEGGGSKMLNDF